MLKTGNGLLARAPVALLDPYKEALQGLGVESVSFPGPLQVLLGLDSSSSGVPTLSGSAGARPATAFCRTNVVRGHCLSAGWPPLPSVQEFLIPSGAAGGISMAQGSTLQVTLPTETLDFVHRKSPVASLLLRAKSFSKGLRRCGIRMLDLNNGLGKSASPAYERLLADPSRGVSLDQVRANFAADNQPGPGSDLPGHPNSRSGRAPARTTRLHRAAIVSRKRSKLCVSAVGRPRTHRCCAVFKAPDVMTSAQDSGPQVLSVGQRSSM